MTTLLYMHPSSLEHDTGPGHPESPARMRAIMTILEREERKGALVGVERREPPRATREQLERVHTGRYVDAVLDAVPESGHVRLDPDTVMSPGSGEAALRTAGAAVAAVDAVIGGEADNAFCALRPPGHHAEAERAMGFCLFNSVAIGARQALDVHGLERVSIFDFDVHHGNGTQHSFEREPRVQYLSTHQWPLYPGTGARDETGVGNIVNRPLPAGTGSREWRRVVEADILRGDRRLRPGADHDLGRIRCPPRRSARHARAGGGRLRLGHRSDWSSSRESTPVAAWCRCSRAAMISRRWRNSALAHLNALRES